MPDRFAGRGVNSNQNGMETASKTQLRSRGFPDAHDDKLGTPSHAMLGRGIRNAELHGLLGNVERGRQFPCWKYVTALRVATSWPQKR